MATGPRLTFRPDRATYLRDNAWMAAVAMALGMAVLWAMDSPHVWTGAVGGLLAIGLRGWYLASEELAADWAVKGKVLHGPGGRAIPLGDVREVNRIFTTVQIVTASGDKHLIKFQADARGAQARLRAACPGATTR